MVFVVSILETQFVSFGAGVCFFLSRALYEFTSVLSH